MRTHPIPSALGAAFLAGALAIPTEAQDTQPTGEVEAVRRHIAANSQSGIFSIYDPREGRPLALTLDEVHAGAHAVGSGELFHCADFRDADGNLYDIDFYVDASGGAPVVVDSFIHKAAGEERIRPAEDAAAVPGDTASAVRAAIAEQWAEPVTIHDARQGEDLTLTLDHVHDGVMQTADGSFFACVDARSSDGTLYDIDTYVRPADGGYRTVERLIHQRAGVERLR